MKPDEKMQHYLVVKSIGAEQVVGLVIKTYDTESAARSSSYVGNVVVFPASIGTPYKIEETRNVADSIIAAEDMLGRPR